MNISSILANASMNPATAASAATTAATSAATAASSSSTSSSASSSSSTVINPNSTLNQQDFLQLLVAQIQYQDPMNPQSDTDMAAQLAQFTALQQASQSSSSLAMMQANGLVGSTVAVQVDSQTSASGVVTGVVLNGSTPQITINGTNYNLSQVTSVTPTPTPTAASQTTTTTPATSTSSTSN